MVLCKNDLQALLVALDLSQQTMRRIQINYFWALCYNACLVPVAAGVLYPAYHFALAPMLAGMAMALSSVSIVVSSLWLARYQPPVLFSGNQIPAATGKPWYFSSLFSQISHNVLIYIQSTEVEIKYSILASILLMLMTFYHN